MYQWNDAFMFGDPTIDSQHRTFFDTINQLEQKGVSGISIIELNTLVVYLQDYVKNHAATEEVYMKLHNYPFLKQHQQIHQSFATQVETIYQQLREKKPPSELALSISHFMGEYLIDHILNVDLALAAFVRSGELRSIS